MSWSRLRLHVDNRHVGKRGVSSRLFEAIKSALKSIVEVLKERVSFSDASPATLKGILLAYDCTLVFWLPIAGTYTEGLNNSKTKSGRTP